MYFRHEQTATPEKKDPATIRIIAVGGSTTANERPYSKNKVDYAIALESKLSSGFTGHVFEVLNAGADAYSTAQSLINIQFRLSEFKPDLILLMHNVNDASVNSFAGGATPDYANKYMQPYYLNPSLQGTLSWRGFFIQSRLLTKLGLPQLIASKWEHINKDNSHANGLRLFKRNLATIAAVCRLHDIELVLLSQPNSMRRQKYINKEVVLDYNNAISEVAEEQNIVYVDMYNKFGHDKTYFLDSIHYTPEGIERFSDILYQELRKTIAARIEKNKKPS